MKRRAFAVLVAVFFGILIAILQGVVGPAALIAHGGGLDSQGCHNDRQRGGYHCHRGPLAGGSFSSAAAAAEAMRARSAPAPKALPVITAPATALGLVASPSPSQTSGVFDSFERQSRILVLKDAIGTIFQFSVRDDTMIANGDRADDYFETHPATLPWKAGQSVVIAWRPSADQQKRVAISIR